MRLASDRPFRDKLPRGSRSTTRSRVFLGPLGTNARRPAPAPGEPHREHQGMALVTDALITRSPGRLFEGLYRAGAAAAHSRPR